MTRWSSHSEAMLQASLMTSTGTCSGRVQLTSASSTDVALALLTWLTDQATVNGNNKDIL